MYLFPYIYDLFQEHNHVPLMSRNLELNKELIFLNNKELNDKIIENRPLLQRQILKINKKLQDTMELHGGYFEEQTKLFGMDKMYSMRKYIDSPSSYRYLSDHPSCTDATITCSGEYLYCNDSIINNHYDMKIPCKAHNQMAQLFSSPKSSLYMYSDVEKTNLVDLKYMCDFDVDFSGVNTNVVCISYNDVSDNVFNSNVNYKDKSYYACKNVSTSNVVDSNGENKKYKIIMAYDDKDDVLKAIQCDSTKESFKSMKEGFENHFLDDLVQDENLLTKFTEDEQNVIQNSINDGNTNMRETIEKLRHDPEMLQAYIISHFSSNDNYMNLLGHINEFNNEKNKFLNNRLSYLVQMINMRNGIHDYNYHYGISFWVYFDSHILKDSYSQQYGLIMDYGNQPKIYYDLTSRELKIDILQNNESETVYKTNKLIFQRWNHFVVNYNYGTLDIFVNNNLVSSINNLEPYIQSGRNNIVFGSDEHPLNHCGLSDVRYYDIPLDLSQIKKLYNDKNRESYRN
jgi:hypothetical protein